MSLREEDREKNNCPSRGLGLAAAAIGVGVGAALYYFFSKREEQPNSEGASSSNWSCEDLQNLNSMQSEESYITVSEHSTTDTSIIDLSSDQTSMSTDSDTDTSSTSSEPEESLSSLDSSIITESYDSSSQSDTDMDWDVSIDPIHHREDLVVPQIEISRSRSPLSSFFGGLLHQITSTPSPIRRQQRDISDQAFRQRTWDLEECSICFDVILKDQVVSTLACTHRFHAACIAPWLQEQQTCPNCRKQA